jgi:hypothetical protein
MIHMSRCSQYDMSHGVLESSGLVMLRPDSEPARCPVTAQNIERYQKMACYTI